MLVFTALAWLQVHWSRDIADATSVRLQSNLQASVVRFREDLYREFSGIAAVFQGEGARPQRGVLNYYGYRFTTWQRSAIHPRLVSEVYVWNRNDENSTLERLDTKSAAFAPADWPENLSRVHEALNSGLRGPHGGLFSRPDHNGEPPWPAGGQRFEKRESGATGNGPRQHTERIGLPRMGPWFVAEDVPALVGRTEGGSGDEEWVIVVLDETVFTKHILPELALRYFGNGRELEYHVAIVNGTDPSKFVFNSDPSVPIAVDRADAVAKMFGPLLPPGTPAISQNGRGFDGHANGTGNPGTPHFESLQYSPGARGWLLVAQNRKGSLEAAVDQMHWRNLSISFAVLLVLAAAIAFMFISTQRARRLAQMQMDFVAAVSHELRTPLAVISSAAENIADGVVDNKQQLVRYGRVIKGQARQLINLIEQILLFASSQQDGSQYHMQEVPVARVIEAAVGATEETVRAAGFRIERSADANLPDVLCDPMALSHVLQNLITNAVKYGGEAQWIGLSAEMVTSGPDQEVRISVRDRGVGIAVDEAERIFEPFYRSRAATAAQIHGTGLGLSVARTMTEGMNGKLAVVSEAGKGSTFTVSLPAVIAHPKAAEGVETGAAGRVEGRQNG